jgi:hypothetical protein
LPVTPHREQVTPHRDRACLHADTPRKMDILRTLARWAAAGSSGVSLLLIAVTYGQLL